MTVELRARLEKRAGRPLPSTLTFNYPNVMALAGFFEKLLFGPSEKPVPATAALQPALAPVAAPTAQDELTEEHLEQLLAAKLKAL